MQTLTHVGIYNSFIGVKRYRLSSMQGFTLHLNTDILLSNVSTLWSIGVDTLAHVLFPDLKIFVLKVPTIFLIFGNRLTVLLSTFINLSMFKFCQKSSNMGRDESK